jgi:hypothetical protein
MSLTGHIASMGENINPYKIFEGRPDGKRIREIPKSTYWDHVRIEHCYTNKILYCALN